ncbi:MAG: cation diffusion facilitator family transporter [Lachnospiraceae bacterium]|nr:cation diffusion facilitator family transporter [Lachnospiraceae bacterium]
MSQNNKREKTESELKENRNKIIVRASIIGICANVLLAAFKAFIGILANSIAVILDAVNNLSDALSSVITIVGTKLAGKHPDKKHPFGYGRVEYLSAMVVAAIVLYAGITSFVESVKKIIHPEKADYSVLSLVIISVAIVVKIVLGKYVKGQGKKVHSSALEASGSDALFDAILSTSVLASAIIYMFSGLSLEAFVGVIISVIIIKSGLEMLVGTLDDILGQRADAELTKKIRKLVNEEKEVRGVYDLILNNYGPNKNLASLHVELPDTMNVEEVDILTRRIQVKVYRETGVIVTSVGVYSYNTKDDDAAHVRNKVMQTVLAHDWALQLHGFYIDMKNKHMRFDVVVSFDMDPNEAVVILKNELNGIYPDYAVTIAPDLDAAD